jgi:hypothetical protein
MKTPGAFDTEAEAAPPSARYERKFLAPGLPLENILAAVRLHPASFRQTYPDRVVNNIYLDTPSLQDYFAHVTGARRRSKTRVRWYGGVDTNVEQPVLGRKIKWAGVGGKQWYALPPFRIGPTWTRRHLRGALDAADLPEAIRLSLRHVEPVLINRYCRHYVQSVDGRFRLTVDSDLRVCAIARTGGPFRLPLRLGIEVVEVKYAPDHAEGSAAIANKLPVRLAQYSKYVAAIALLRGV